MAFFKKTKVIFFPLSVCFLVAAICSIFSGSQPDFVYLKSGRLIWNETRRSNELLNRQVTLYSSKVEKIRTEILQQASTFKCHPIACHSTSVQVADAQSSDYFLTVKRFPQIKTVFYEESMENISRYLRPRYYDYLSNDCNLLESRSKGGNYLGKKKYGAECRQSFKETWHGKALEKVALGVGLPGSAIHGTNGSRIITFIHLIPNGISFSDGDVFHGNLKIVPQKCKKIVTKACADVNKLLPTYKEVFTISQFWGKGFFHGTLEDLPRIAPYLPFLRKYRHIKIHVPSEMKYLRFLGIDNSRMLTEPVVHAELLYMPAGGPCGNPPLFTTQALGDAFARNTLSTEQRDVIVLIKRSHKRWFAHHDAILRMLQRHAANLNLVVEVFADDPLPDINKTTEMFSRALAVVAPHGAGEANLIFSQPGTLLLEGLCYDSNKFANLCYRNMAQALGLRYFGLIYKHQCMKIKPEDIERPLLGYLKNVFAIIRSPSF